jgi:hypothetical protein
MAGERGLRVDGIIERALDCTLYLSNACTNMVGERGLRVNGIVERALDCTLYLSKTQLDSTNSLAGHPCRNLHASNRREASARASLPEAI